MSILEEVYASAPSDKVLIHTIQIDHPAIDSLYFCRAYDDITAATELESEVIFTAAALELQLPQKGVKGREDLVFNLDNVNGEAIQALDEIMEAAGNASITYRSYISTDLSGPQEVIGLVATSASIDMNAASITATFRDFVNRAWPRNRYTLDGYPGLKYV